MRVLDALAAQRGHLFPWAPVALAAGIGSYFALRQEPGPYGWLAVSVLAILALAGASWGGERRAPLFLLGFLVLSGLLLAGARAHMVAAPVLDHRFYGALSGRIVEMDRSLSDKPRLTLDRVWMEGRAARQTPRRVRVSLHGRQGFTVLRPGRRVMMTAHLAPPPGPSEPGGFSFRRLAWFERLGAVGYTRNPALTIAPAKGRFALALHRARTALSAAIRARLPGDTGAFAAAILTGDRSAMSRDTLQALRDSNLAHLLAISGLHMGLLSGFVFAALRFGMALVPPVALRWPVKKIAAAVALPAAAAYLALSGGNVATQRAFVMVAVMLVAILFDRRALTLRAVALAAIIVLVLRPESLAGPGFQMSFAATAALVAVFGMIRDWPPDRWRPPRWLRPVLAVVISSLVAGMATAPIGAAHFNQVAQYGLLANLLSVPLMGTVVIPAAVLAGILAPFGLAFAGLEVMQWGIVWILGVAHWVADLDGATWPVVTPPPVVLPIFALGGLWLILWQGRARLAGLAPMALAFVIWGLAERPALLIADSGGLIGVMTSEGRALSKPGGDGFAARSWLENDGDAATQPMAHDRAGLSGGPGLWWAEVAGQRVIQLSGRGWADRLERACDLGWVVTARVVEIPRPAGCVLLDQRALRRTGAIALYANSDGVRRVTARQISGRRPWTRAQ